jgi:hypothetical protein
METVKLHLAQNIGMPSETPGSSKAPARIAPSQSAFAGPVASADGRHVSLKEASLMVQKDSSMGNFS